MTYDTGNNSPDHTGRQSHRRAAPEQHHA